VELLFLSVSVMQLVCKKLRDRRQKRPPTFEKGLFLGICSAPVDKVVYENHGFTGDSVTQAGDKKKNAVFMHFYKKRCCRKKITPLYSAPRRRALTH
jgi:hypothetical protein